VMRAVTPDSGVPSPSKLVHFNSLFIDKSDSTRLLHYLCATLACSIPTPRIELGTFSLIPAFGLTLDHSIGLAQRGMAWDATSYACWVGVQNLRRSDFAFIIYLNNPGAPGTPRRTLLRNISSSVSSGLFLYSAGRMGQGGQ
jgi:hypothetical protein